MVNDKVLRVLLCSPINIMNCGISRWTNHIMSYYKRSGCTVSLRHYYPIVKGVYSDTPFFKRIFIGLQGYIPFLINLRTILKVGEYDVLHFISSGSIALLRDIITIYIAGKFNVKTIIHFRFGRIPEVLSDQGWECKLLERAIRKVDKVIVIDQSSYVALKNRGYHNVFLLPNPLSPNIQDIISKHELTTRNESLIVFVGHVVVTKGVYELVEVCKGIENIKLRLIGYVTDNVRSDLLKLAGERASEWLQFTGEQDQDFVIKEMLSAGVFVLPTYTEGFPNVILESMACGCPIVTTSVGAIPEMLDIQNEGKNGLCVTPKSTKELKRAIERMIRDREFALECGSNAQKRVNALYSMESVWNSLEGIWKQSHIF